MCLGIPGEIVGEPTGNLRIARVSFSGVVKEISLVYLPEAKVGDYVIIHAGFAISVIDPEEAKTTLMWIDEAERALAAG
jgi:hydrogenase expression/formation protein HypC